MPPNQPVRQPLIVSAQMPSASNMNPPLILAAASGDAALLARLLARGAELEARDAHGFTALHCACAKGQLECAEALLEAGCDAAAVASNGRTGLMLAAGGGHAALLARLLARGAELEARSADGATALHFACMKGRLECTEALLDAGAACGSGALPRAGRHVAGLRLRASTAGPARASSTPARRDRGALAGGGSAARRSWRR